MKYKYVVILKQGSHRTIDIFSILLCGCSAAAFIFTAVRSGLTADYIFYLLGALIFAGLIFNGVARFFRTKSLSYRFLLGFAAIGWIVMPSRLSWIGLIFVLLIFLETQAKHAVEIGFDTDRIVFNTLYSRRCYWSDLNNVILRDGLLTIDFKNNRLIQREIADDPDEDDADEDEFNAFCREQLDLVRDR
ncbi:MAG TPA: hypothetical protein VMH27_11125 [Puia sp.]|nr:hypothetical protein [Puia sp.]